MILIFEGPDKVGKTTLMKAMNKRDSYNHYNIDRGPAGYITYDLLFNRNNYEREKQNLLWAENLNKQDVLFIYLYCSKDIVEQRLKDHRETYPTEFGIEDASELYEFYIDELYNNNKTIKIDTGNFDIDTCCNIIENFMKDQENSLIPKYTESCYIEYQPIHKVYTKKLMNQMYVAEERFDDLIDEPYYDMLFYTLEQLMHKYDIGMINRRQIVYSSLDCISYVQIVLKENNSVEIIVVQRSLDIKKYNMWNDLKFFSNWIRKSKYNEKYFDDYTINYTISCPHEFIGENDEHE